MDEEDYFAAYQDGRHAGYEEGYENALASIEYVWLCENHRGIYRIYLDYDKALEWYKKQLEEQDFDPQRGDYVHSYDIDDRASVEAFTANGDTVASIIPYEIKG